MLQETTSREIPTRGRTDHSVNTVDREFTYIYSFPFRSAFEPAPATPFATIAELLSQSRDLENLL